jgi:hypothetical protein
MVESPQLPAKILLLGENSNALIKVYNFLKLIFLEKSNLFKK